MAGVRAVVIACVWIIAACMTNPEAMSCAADCPIKPALDSLQYSVIILENGLKAILVHDPEADKAAAALDAHFTEHMLFFGSTKYPEEDAYSKFVMDHGGSTNAYTASENTNYHFDINWEHLEPALDRFAQFFVCPTISADGVSRELKAVDSEHGKNLALDAWRQMQLHKHLANPGHPWARFATGNLETLRDKPQAAGLDVRQAVVDFHGQHYSANLMRLVVLGRQSIAELKAMVRTMFSAVPSHGIQRPVFGSDVFLPDQRRVLCRVVPVREGQSIEFAWQIPPTTPLYRCGPSHYLSHLMGHEGTGSMFALLKSLGWASSLVSGESGVGISSAAFFYVHVDLTEEGHAHVQEVGAIIFKYLSLLRAGGIQESIWQEMKSLAELRFNFRDKMSPDQYVTSVAASSQDYPDRDVLLAMYNVPQEYDAECIRAALAEMTLDKVRVLWASKKHVVSSTEPWYGTQYDLAPLPEAWLQAWSTETVEAQPDARLHLPELNPFIPHDFALREAAASSAPQHPLPVVMLPQQICLWHKCDVSFKVPKAVINLDFQMPESYGSPDSAVMTRLYVKLLMDYLNEMAYPAELAGLSYSVSNTQTGFTVVCSGYNHKLRVLLDAILDKIATFKVLPDRFGVMREEAAKEYANMRYQQPYQWALYRRELLMQLKRWRLEEYEQVATNATAQQLSDFIPRLMSRVYVEGLAVGNLAVDEAQELARHVQTMLRERMGALPIFASQMRDLRAVALPKGGTSLYTEAGPNAANDNSAVVAVYQAGRDDVRCAALVQLAVQLFEREAFHELRTVQQLGYIVSLFSAVECGVYNFQILVQSNSISAQECAARIDAFVGQLFTRLAAKCVATPQEAAAADGSAAGPATADEDAAPATVAASDEDVSASGAEAGGATEFARAVRELAKAKLERPKRLGELSQRWWSEIYGGGLRFDRREVEVDELRRLSPADMTEFMRRTIVEADTQHKLVVQVRGSAELKASQIASESSQPEGVCAGSGAAPVDDAQAGGGMVRVITDIAAFKRSCSVHSAVVPHLVPQPTAAAMPGAAS